MVGGRLLDCEELVEGPFGEFCRSTVLGNLFSLDERLQVVSRRGLD